MWLLKRPAKPARSCEPNSVVPKKSLTKAKSISSPNPTAGSEALIVTRLRREFPDHAIVAEEGSAGAAARAKYTWHVDPLDGTTNFAHGYPCFAVSIGLHARRQAARGRGAESHKPMSCLPRAAAKAHISTRSASTSRPIEKLAESLVCTGFPPSIGEAASI